MKTMISSAQTTRRMSPTVLTAAVENIGPHPLTSTPTALFVPCSTSAMKMLPRALLNTHVQITVITMPMSSVFRTVEQAEDQAAQQRPVLLLEPWQREAAPARLFGQGRKDHEDQRGRQIGGEEQLNVVD